MTLELAAFEEAALSQNGDVANLSTRMIEVLDEIFAELVALENLSSKTAFLLGLFGKPSSSDLKRNDLSSAPSSAVKPASISRSVSSPSASKPSPLSQLARSPIFEPKLVPLLFEYLDNSSISRFTFVQLLVFCGVDRDDACEVADGYLEQFGTPNKRMTRQNWIAFYHQACSDRIGEVRKDLIKNGYTSMLDRDPLCHDMFERKVAFWNQMKKDIMARDRDERTCDLTRLSFAPQHPPLSPTVAEIASATVDRYLNELILPHVLRVVHGKAALGWGECVVTFVNFDPDTSEYEAALTECLVRQDDVVRLFQGASDAASDAVAKALSARDILATVSVLHDFTGLDEEEEEEEKPTDHYLMVDLKWGSNLLALDDGKDSENECDETAAGSTNSAGRSKRKGIVGKTAGVNRENALRNKRSESSVTSSSSARDGSTASSDGAAEEDDEDTDNELD